MADVAFVLARIALRRRALCYSVDSDGTGQFASRRNKARRAGVSVVVR